MEESTEKNLSLLVYHYLMEQCMADVAEMFAAKSPFLKGIERSPVHCMLTNIPFKSLLGIVKEYESLLHNMKTLVWNYYEKVPVKFGKNTWEKIEFMVRYFEAQAANNSNQSLSAIDATASENESVPNSEVPADSEMPAMEETNNIACTDSIVQSEDMFPPVELTSLLYMDREVENPVNQQCHSSTVNCATVDENDPVSCVENVTDQPQPQMQQEHQTGSEYNDTNNLELNSFVSLPEQPNVYSVAPGNLAQITKTTVVFTMERTQVTSLQTEDIVTMEEQYTDNGHLDTPMIEPALPASPSLSANKENQEPFPVCSGTQPAESPSSSSATIDLSESTSSLELGEFESTLPKQVPTERKNPIDPDALAEWNRIRSVNNRNFDDHIRLLNNEAELRNRIQEVTKGATAKSKASPLRLRPKRQVFVKPSAQKRCETNKPEGGQIATTEKSPVNSDTSDFASSDEEDEQIRQMSNRVKQWRKQNKKRLLTKDKKPEDSPRPSTIHTSPSSLPQCRVNLIAGSSGRNTAVKRGMGNRPPSTSPVGSQAKVSIESDGSPSRRIRGCTWLRPMPKSVTTIKQPVAPAELEPEPVPSTPPKCERTEPEPVSSTSKSGRPVRACTMNRKTISDDVDAAIYAVLAQLHGDN